MSPEDKAMQRADEVDPTIAAGFWGGPHIRLHLNESGGEVEYDSGRGTLSEALKIDSEGRFSIKGTHTNQPPGPIRSGFQPRTQPALFTGILTGQTLELTVTLTEPQTIVGTFKLTQGNEGRLWKSR